MEDDFLYFVDVNLDNDDYVEEYYPEDYEELDFEEQDDEQH